MQIRDDALGQRSRETERRANRIDAVADLHAVRIAERDRMELRGWRRDTDDGQVIRGIRSDDRSVVGLAIAEFHGDLLRARDYVVVRQDVSFCIEDDARARALA